MTQSQKDITLEMKQAMAAGQFDRAVVIGVRLLRAYSKRTDIQIMIAVSELQSGSVMSAGRRLKTLFNSYH